MAIRLNGWRRIGIVFVVAWCLSAIGTAIYEWKSPAKNHNDSFFTYYDTSPSKVVSDTKPIKPMSPEEWLASKKVFNWSYFIIALLVIPGIGWVLCEGLVALVLWVYGGFKNNNVNL